MARSDYKDGKKKDKKDKDTVVIAAPISEEPKSPYVGMPESKLIELLEKKDKRIKTLEVSAVETESKLQEFDSNLQKEKETNSALRENNSYLQTQLSEAKKLLTEEKARSKVDEKTKKEIADLKKDVAEKDAEIANLQKDCENRIAKANADHKAKAEATTKQHQTEVSKLKKRIKKLEEAASLEGVDIDSITAEIQKRVNKACKDAIAGKKEELAEKKRKEAENLEKQKELEMVNTIQDYFASKAKKLKDALDADEADA